MKLLSIICLLIVAMTANAADQLFDEKLASNALAVLRVKLIFSTTYTSSNMFTSYYVRTLEVYKNESNTRIGHNLSLEVGAFRGRPGIPKAECTVYLQRYDRLSQSFTLDKDRGLWVLVGGDATNGVSDVQYDNGSP